MWKYTSHTILSTFVGKALICGGWQTTDIAASSRRSGYTKGVYLNTCEDVKNSAGAWEASSASLVKHRAFFSMSTAGDAIFAFRGDKIFF